MPHLASLGSFGWRRRLRTAAVISSLFFGAITQNSDFALAQPGIAQLTTIYPPGGKQGAKVEVTVAGTDLDEASKVLFSHPGIVATPKMSDMSEFVNGAKPVANTFQVQIGGDVPQGIYEARVVSRFGISNPRSFCVGTVDEVVEASGNNSLEKAMELAVGPIVNGRADASLRDFYKVTLAKGQRVLIECLAKRIDSKMDPVISVYSPEGSELVRIRDNGGGDATLDFTAPTAGTYYVALVDFVYGGGADYFYRLSVHTRPYIDFIFPPSGVAGSKGPYTIYGRNLPGGVPASDVKIDGAVLQKITAQIEIPNDATKVHAPTDQSIAPRIVAADGVDYRLAVAAPVMVYVAKAPVILEKEPNNDAKSGQKVTVPCEYVGQFFPASDIDWLQFEAKKGDSYILEVFSHRLGLPSDPFVLVQKVAKNAKGEETVSDVASVDDPSDRNNKIGGDFDTSTDDPVYKFTASEDATYRVMIRDQFGSGRSDPRMIYRVAIRQAQPDFRLTAVSIPGDSAATGRNNNQNQGVGLGSPVVRRGGTAMIQVSVDRTDDFKGEIQVSVEGLPPGLVCNGATISGDANTASLIFVASEDAAGWSGPIKILGKGTQDGKELVRQARFGTVVWGTTNRQQNLPEFRVARDLAIAVNDKETAIAFIQAGDGKVIETSLGATVDIPVKVTRRGDFKDALKLVASGLPTDIKPADLNIDGKAAEGKFQVPLNANNIKAGVYTFYLKGDAKTKYVRNPDLQKSAEEDQKFIVALLPELEKKVKEATAAKEAATKAKETADAVAKADEALKEAQKKLDTAKKMKQDADKKVGDAKTAMAPKDATFLLVSTPITIRVGTSPMKLSLGSPAVSLKQAEKVEAELKLERLYGFADQVEVTIEGPKGVAGLSGTKLTLAKDKKDGKLEIKTEKNTPPGEHNVTIRAKAKFNNVNVESTEQLVVKVEKS